MWLNCRRSEGSNPSGVKPWWSNNTLNQMTVRPSQKLQNLLGVQVSPWRKTLRSAKEELYGVYKPTGNPQGVGVPATERKDEKDAMSNLFKVGQRVFPHIIYSVCEYLLNKLSRWRPDGYHFKKPISNSRKVIAKLAIGENLRTVFVNYTLI